MTENLKNSDIPAAVIEKRSDELLKGYLAKINRQTNMLFSCLMLLEWAAAVATAIFISPRAWNGTQSQIHLHVWISIFLGGIITSLPVFLTITRPESAITRHVIAISQMLFAALLIHLSGGRIETHFHIFGSLAFLSFYRDWKVLITATIVVAVDHFLRGAFWPESVYGVLNASNWRTLEHAGWVIFEDTVLIIACNKAITELKSIAFSQSTLESTNIIIEDQVKQRTQELMDAQEKLKTARDKAIELAKVKSEFLANMSHEIRTPLNGVIGTMDLVLESTLTNEQQDLIKTGYNSAKSLLTIINDILDVSKIESGKFTLSPISFNLDAFLNECELLVSPLVQERNITLIINRAANVPQNIYTDEVKLRQILINLIGNSIKFTSTGGGIFVYIQAGAVNGKEIELHFSVSDSGKGIEKSKCELIFEAFNQEDNTIARKYGGTGLGLTISKSIVEMMGGKVSVKSRENIGSTFQFFIKVEISEDTVTKKEEKAVNDISADNEKCHILLAEDNVVNQKITVKLLQNKGFKVTVVENGKLALKALGDSSFDLVLMDVQMPVMDGIEAIKIIRNSSAQWSKVPIIALTAHALMGDKESLLSIGANSYISKPIDKNQFYKEIAAFTQH